AAPVIVTIDAGEELAVVETQRDALAFEPIRIEVPIDVPVDRSHDRAFAPKTVPKKPAAPGSGSAAAAPAPSAVDVAKLYGALGRELKALEATKGMDATIELWPRYRWIRINEWITTPERRAHIADLLERLRVDIKASY
ncbi:MAG TPA: hypothetical protein VIV11_24875, partial [Kofleriaceae bacterium]